MGEYVGGQPPLDVWPLGGAYLLVHDGAQLHEVTQQHRGPFGAGDGKQNLRQVRRTDLVNEDHVVGAVHQGAAGAQPSQRGRDDPRLADDLTLGVAAQPVEPLLNLRVFLLQPGPLGFARVEARLQMGHPGCECRQVPPLGVVDHGPLIHGWPTRGLGGAQRLPGPLHLLLGLPYPRLGLGVCLLGFAKRRVRSVHVGPGAHSGGGQPLGLLTYRGLATLQHLPGVVRLPPQLIGPLPAGRERSLLPLDLPPGPAAGPACRRLPADPDRR